MFPYLLCSSLTDNMKTIPASSLTYWVAIRLNELKGIYYCLLENSRQMVWSIQGYNFNCSFHPKRTLPVCGKLCAVLSAPHPPHLGLSHSPPKPQVSPSPIEVFVFRCLSCLKHALPYVQDFIFKNFNEDMHPNCLYPAFVQLKWWCCVTHLNTTCFLAKQWENLNIPLFCSILSVYKGKHNKQSLSICNS